MPKRSSNPRKHPPKDDPTDPILAAARIFRQVTGEEKSKVGPPQPTPTRQKNPHAIALGKLGGAKGGKARAAKLSKKERSRIARKAANRRWKNS